MSESKACTKCGTAKLLSEFRLQKRKTGYFPTSWCRVCSNTLAREMMREHSKRPAVKAAKAAYSYVYDRTPERMEASRIRGREYQSRPEIKARTKAYLAEYMQRPGVAEMRREYARGWVDANREAARAHWRKYYQTDRGKLLHRLQESKRRALEANAENDFTWEQWGYLLEAWNGQCAYCGSEENITIDHVVPISAKGGHTMGNVVPACLSCNSAKNRFRLPAKQEAHMLELATRFAEEWASLSP